MKKAMKKAILILAIGMMGCNEKEKTVTPPVNDTLEVGYLKVGDSTYVVTTHRAFGISYADSMKSLRARLGVDNISSVDKEPCYTIGTDTVKYTRFFLVCYKDGDYNYGNIGQTSTGFPANSYLKKQ